MERVIYLDVGLRREVDVPVHITNFLCVRLGLTVTARVETERLGVTPGR